MIKVFALNISGSFFKLIEQFKEKYPNLTARFDSSVKNGDQ